LLSRAPATDRFYSEMQKHQKQCSQPKHLAPMLDQPSPPP
jgi:hypothetical protein